MTLNVTPGDADARAYATVAELKTYAGDYGHALVDGSGNAYSDTALEQALRQGAVLLGLYAPRWPGQRSTAAQRMDWPRINATWRDGQSIDGTDIPSVVKDANCEAALRALTNPTDIRTVVDASRRVKKTQAGDAVIEYFDIPEGSAARSTLTAVEDLLAGLLKDAPTAQTNKTAKRNTFMVAGS